MALKLTRKGIVILSIVGFFLLLVVSSITAIFLLKEDDVSFVDVFACSSLSGCNDDDPSTGGGDQCHDGRGTPDGCWRFICPQGCGGGTNPTNCDGDEPGAYKQTVGCDSKIPSGQCGQIDMFKDGTYCGVIDVECDCDTTPPEVSDKPPVCDSLTVSKTTVKSGTEQIEVTIKGSDPDGTPSKLEVYATAGGQINKNPGDFNCSPDPLSAEYSFYCTGGNSFALSGSKENSTTHTYTTTFNELKSKVDGLSAEYTGDLGAKGVQLVGNVSEGGNICTSNPAYNNGSGALYNGGAFDEACEGGCLALISLQEPPKCDSFSVSKTTVSSATESIQVTVKGTGSNGAPTKMEVYAAAAGQINKNPSDFKCSPDPLDANYSFYCTGGKAFALAGSNTNNSTYTFTTTFAQLKNKVDALNSGYTGNLNDKGVLLVANIFNSADLCTSNIAYNNGNGVLYNGGAFNEACVGGCFEEIKLNEPPPVSPECGDGVCNNSSEYCENNLSCSTNTQVVCRDDCTYCGDGVINGGEDCDPNAPGETAATCSNSCKRLVTVNECNDSCNTDSDCASPWKCDTTTKTCRNESCPAESSCTCPAAPYCGDDECNQDHEQCENNVSCQDGSSVSCRTNCTYCGDGIINNNEQCDDGNSVDTDECRNDCTLPYCGDGNLDPGEDCDDGNSVDDDECNNDCKIPEPPAWTIEKDGTPACITGKELSATVEYKITVTNTGEGKGDLEKVVDTLDQTIQESWIEQASVQPTAVYLQSTLTWMLATEEMTLQPNEKKEFVYKLNVPSTGFGTLTNTAEGFPVDGDSFSVENEESVMCSTETPKTGLLDSSLAKIGIGLILVSLSGLYFYYEGTDGLLMRLLYTDEKVAHNRDEFEKKLKNKDK